ncbi:patatin-like phospholipase family protein [Arenibaculum pallidiluteum]|uniref:patatin-like phospholipase family protein n=1 Tax=Arenibaculum pallidiluteum TaxID=2812559 RepID=UPI001A96EB28|nr:patatin-like phospholipase family protein [Arenibaculum pallidiluteum]
MDTHHPQQAGPAAATRQSPAGARVALVLGGGNALGAYLAGAYERLSEDGFSPDWIIGASIGAVTAAILAGNPPEHRLDKLRVFWSEATQHTMATSLGGHSMSRKVYNGAHAALAALACRPNMFRHRFPGAWSVLPWMPNDVALYDASPLRETLVRHVDFDRLNSGAVRLTVGCVDMESGEEVFFDTERDEIRPEHILASAAITPAFPPVEIGGRLFCDPGYANNMPLDVPFREPSDCDLLCFAVELFSLRSERPASLDASIERTQDILFASHARRSVEWLRRESALRERIDPRGSSATLVHLAYRAANHELAAKGFDFSPSSITDRWATGRNDMDAGLQRLARNEHGEQRFRYVSV